MIPVSTLKEYESRYNNLLTVHESPGGDPVLETSGLKIAVVLSGVMVPVTKFGCRYHPVVPMHNVKFSRLSRDREPKVEERQQMREHQNNGPIKTDRYVAAKSIGSLMKQIGTYQHIKDKNPEKVAAALIARALEHAHSRFEFCPFRIFKNR